MGFVHSFALLGTVSAPLGEVLRPPPLPHLKSSHVQTVQILADRAMDPALAGFEANVALVRPKHAETNIVVWGNAFH